MKKTALLLALFLVFLTACGERSAAESAPAVYVSTSEAAQAVAGYLGWEDLSPLEQKLRDFYLSYMYWLEEGSWTEATIYAAEGADARELVILRLSGGEYTETVTAALEEYREVRQGDFCGYFPAQAALVEKGQVVELEGYAALVICEDPAGAVGALQAVLKGEPIPQPTPTPLPTPTPSPPFEDEPIPTLDISNYVPFDPPNRYYVRPYDTTAILEAYASEDESGLSKRDAAILARCKEGLERITGDMSDFGKELALRDWMLQQGSYDESVLSGESRLGRIDSINPYGYLVRGYGICFGYASTFQLLMDLAGVECVTVVGAAYKSTEDHAWNMVKLEGEWYCVDTTWDIDGAYNYFNVTSDYMRRTDHQWDYENVPEATATRFYWNGFGKKPN